VVKLTGDKNQTLIYRQFRARLARTRSVQVRVAGVSVTAARPLPEGLRVAHIGAGIALINVLHYHP